ncbi:MAG: amidohydrolase family protein [Syntrophales bacterium]
MIPELLVRNGKIFDPFTRTFQKADIVVSGGRIHGISPPLTGEMAREVLDVSEMIVTPGLIDLHVHIFHRFHRISIDPGTMIPQAGVTTWVDGGSSGAGNFDAFREYVLSRSELNLLAFLNIGLFGQIFDLQIPGVPTINEYDDPRMVHVAETVRCIERNREFIVGVKARAFLGLTSVTPIVAALEAGRETGLPVMIHTAPPPLSVGQYFPLLRPGDILTHLYHPGPGGLLNRQGRIQDEYREVRERGVLMDVGMDRWHTDFEVLQRGIGEGFWPDTISTDITRFNREPLVRDLLFTASKLMAAGLPLTETLAAMTINPARAIQRPLLAELKVGGPANLSILELLSGEVTFKDYFDHEMTGHERLTCRWLIREGKVLH